MPMMSKKIRKATSTSHSTTIGYEGDHHLQWSTRRTPTTQPQHPSIASGTRCKPHRGWHTSQSPHWETVGKAKDGSQRRLCIVFCCAPTVMISGRLRLVSGGWQGAVHARWAVHPIVKVRIQERTQTAREPSARWSRSEA